MQHMQAHIRTKTHVQNPDIDTLVSLNPLKYTKNTHAKTRKKSYNYTKIQTYTQ